MPDPIVDAALARGALIVTPNKRLAREIAFRHDRAQVAAGRSTWPAARVLPWIAFVDGMVRSALDAGLPVPSQRLSPEQSAQLWQRVVRRNLDAPLLDLDAVSVLAEQTWELVHAYGDNGESWRGLDGRGPDTDAFVDWARRYERETARLDAIDAARAAGVVAVSAAALPEIAALDVVFVGFVELSPQERRLIDALRAAGASVEQQDTDSGAPIASTARLVEVTTPRDELIAAFDWARERVSRDASAQVGIVVPDLAQRRNEVRALADDRLCPALAVPGNENAARPYDISLGVPLSDAPLVSCALDLIALGEHPVERARAAALLRSAYLPKADSLWAVRASLERRWLDHSVNALTFDDVLIALERADSALASRWRHLQRATRWPARAPPRAWVEHWRSWLQGAGWIEDRTLDTVEYQVRSAWNDLLVRFAGLSLVTPELTREEASATLRRLARNQIHQPEARGARIRILGMLEAAGLAFDGLWVTGMTADAWPSAPAPNPLLPIRWQRERGVPRSSAAQELDFAHRHTALLSRAAPEVVFSFASRLDEHVRAPSPLVAAFPRLAVASAPLTAERLFLERPPLERIADRLAPVVAARSSVSGGAGVIEMQSGCPFRAMARHRLRAEEWPTVTLGIGPRERGTLVHAALAAFWSEVRDQAGLLALSGEALDACIAGAVEKSRAAIDDAHWHAIPPAVAMSEVTCLREVLREWLELERERASFSVLETEAAARLEIAGFTLDMRLDRVDALASGGVAIVDYKSGRTSPVARWFDARPQGIQLAAYATACAQRALVQPVRALVYGKLRRAEVGPVGLADDEAFWRGVVMPAQVKPSGAVPEDWDSALRSLDARVTTLAQSFAAGDASVTPRDRKVCANCHLHALCRIGATPVDDDEERFETGDDA